MKYWNDFTVWLKKVRDRILNPLGVFKNEVADIRISNENIRRYRIQHLRKDFFSISIKKRDDVFKYLFYLLAIAMLVLLPLMSTHNGISDKEIQHQQRAEMLYQYYSDGNPAILQEKDALTHTQLIDFACYCITKWLNISSVYDFRHLIGALFVWLTFLVIGSFLMNLFSWRAAFFGGFFLMLSPAFLGQSFGNLADISFTFFYLLSLYQIYILIGELPIVKWKRLIFIVLSIAAANSVHVGGFVLLFYMFVSVIVAFIIANPIKEFFSAKYLSNFGKLLLLLLGMLVAVYLLYWLYPLQSLKSLAILPHAGIQQMAENQPIIEILWRGKVLSSHDLTAGFVLERMRYTAPLLITIGVLVHLVVIGMIVRKIHFVNYFLLLLALLFPLYTLVNESYEIYDGWSIYLMIYPLVVMMAAAGYEGVLRKVDDKYTNFVIVSIILLLCFMPLRHELVHYQTVGVYFNEMSGGITTSYGKYVIDEGENANNAACSWVKREAVRGPIHDRIRVCTDGNAGCDYYFRDHSRQFELIHSDLNDSDTLQWDYFISFVDAVPHQKLRQGTWQKRKAAHRIYVENKPIAIILHQEYVVEPEPPTDSIPEEKVPDINLSETATPAK